MQTQFTIQTCEPFFGLELSATLEFSYRYRPTNYASESIIDIDWDTVRVLTASIRGPRDMLVEFPDEVLEEFAAEHAAQWIEMNLLDIEEYCLGTVPDDTPGEDFDPVG